MQVKFIGPDNFHYVTVGREYIVDESKSSPFNFCIFNDRHKECRYPREYFECVKPVKPDNAFVFVGRNLDGDSYALTPWKIYHVDFCQSSALKYSVRNDKKRRVLVPKIYFKAYEGSTNETVNTAHAFAAASIAKTNPAAWNDAKWADFDSRSSASYKAANVVRREYEFSIGWAKTNPALMGNALVKLVEENNFDEWQLTVDNSRKGFITYIAKRK